MLHRLVVCLSLMLRSFEMTDVTEAGETFIPHSEGF